MLVSSSELKIKDNQNLHMTDCWIYVDTFVSGRVSGIVI